MFTDDWVCVPMQQVVQELKADQVAALVLEELGESAATARSRVTLICPITSSSVPHPSTHPSPYTTSSIPIFLYCISLSTNRPPLKCISFNPTRKRTARKVWTVFGLIPEPGRMDIGSIGATRMGSETGEIGVEEFVLE